MSREFEFEYSRQAEKFLAKNPTMLTREHLRSQLREGVLRLMRIDDNNADVKKLKGRWRGYSRLRIGTLRVIFKYEGHQLIIVTIEVVEFRGRVYRKK